MDQKVLLDVVGIGSPMIDVVAQVDDGLLERLNLPKGSMTLVDRERATSIYASMPAAIESSGGSASNTLAGLASLGGRAGFIGKVAMDEMGEVFTHDIIATGVEFEAALAREGSGSTARCLVLVSEDAERTLATHLGVAKTFDMGDIDEGLLSRTKITYLEGYLFDLPPAKEAMRQSLEITRKHGGSVAITLSDSFCVDRHRKDFLSLVYGKVDLVFANETEAMSLFESSTLDVAIEEFQETGAVAAITLGARGSVIVTPTNIIEVPAWIDGPVIDSNGAGDLYAAGFLYGIVNGLGHYESARLGSLCAGEIITHLGARPKINLYRLAIEKGFLQA